MPRTSRTNWGEQNWSELPCNGVLYTSLLSLLATRPWRQVGDLPWPGLEVLNISYRVMLHLACRASRERLRVRHLCRIAFCDDELKRLVDSLRGAGRPRCFVSRCCTSSPQIHNSASMAAGVHITSILHCPLAPPCWPRPLHFSVYRACVHNQVKVIQTAHKPPYGAGPPPIAAGGMAAQVHDAHYCWVKKSHWEL